MGVLLKRVTFCSVAVCSAVHSLAFSAESALIQSYLNDSLALSSLPSNASVQSRGAACQKVRGTLSALEQAATQNPDSSYLSDVAGDARELIASLCASNFSPDFSQNFKSLSFNGPLIQGPFSLTGIRGDTLVNLSEWNSQPHCGISGMDSYLCNYNHDGGRGIYIGRPKGEYNANYLVCLMHANASSSVISSQYAIESTCAVSALDWRVYLGVDRIRTDVGGVLQWVDAEIFKTAIRMPAILQKQCDSGFKEANLCTPTIISLPTEQDHMINLCRLNTRRSSIGIPGLLAITSATSSWGCELMNLNVVEDKSRLTVNEDNCLPDFLSNVDSSCVFPTIPRTEEPMRQRIEDAH
jgi:hypothetical protein